MGGRAGKLRNTKRREEEETTNGVYKPVQDPTHQLKIEDLNVTKHDEAAEVVKEEEVCKTGSTSAIKESEIPVESSTTSEKADVKELNATVEEAKATDVSEQETKPTVVETNSEIQQATDMKLEPDAKNIEETESEPKSATSVTEVDMEKPIEGSQVNSEPTEVTAPGQSETETVQDMNSVEAKVEEQSVSAITEATDEARMEQKIDMESNVEIVPEDSMLSAIKAEEITEKAVLEVETESASLPPSQEIPVPASEELPSENNDSVEAVRQELEKLDVAATPESTEMFSGSNDIQGGDLPKKLDEIKADLTACKTEVNTELTNGDAKEECKVDCMSNEGQEVAAN